MVVVGAGTNLGDRAHHLRRAIALLTGGPDPVLRGARVSRAYRSPALLPDGAPRDWDLPFLNLAVSGSTSLTPRELLSALKEIEAKAGRKSGERWAPRALDLDILAWEGREVVEPGLEVPHPGVADRAFALLPLAELAPEIVIQGRTAASRARDFSARGEGPGASPDPKASLDVLFPRIMGIVNVTPDSFSDGGRSMAPERAIEHALALAAEGASIVDVGAESTRPGARAVGPDEEWSRLGPVLPDLVRALRAKHPHARVSVDTRHALTAERSIEAGAHWINDVSGLCDPRMIAVARASRADFVFMHSLTVPADRTLTLPEACDPAAEVIDWGRWRIRELEAAGVPPERLIFDPGVGFGKTPEQSLRLLKDAGRFASLPARSLIGHSRKSCFNLLTAKPFAERDVETLAASLELARRGIDFVRVHDVAGHARAFAAAWALRD